MSIRVMTLSQLADQCAAEQKSGQDHSSCFEILCRALDRQDGEAWGYFEQQFRDLFYFWIHRDLSYYGLASPSDDTLDEIWADSLSRFVERYATGCLLTDNFAHLGAVLKTIQKCIRTTLQLRQREQQRANLLHDALCEGAYQSAAYEKNPADLVALADLRECIQSGLAQDVPEPELLLLLELRFGLNLKPREICEQYPSEFPTVKHVNQQYDRVLKRLKRRLDIYIERCL